MERKSGKPAGGSPGMSLIELMVALTIFAVVLVGIVPMMVLAIGHNRDAKRTVQVRNALANFSETIKTLPMSHAFRQDDGDPDDLTFNNNPNPPDHSVAQDPFVINWNIRQVNAFHQDVRIFINWQDRRGLPRNMSTDITLIGN